MKWGVLDMQSKISWFKREVWKQDFRQVGWIGVIYACTLIFILPINIAMQIGKDQNNYVIREQHDLFYQLPELQITTLFIAPVLLAVFLFRFMHVKQSADFIHSLPISRMLIFSHKIFLGITLLIATDLIVSAILLIMERIIDVSMFYTLSDVWAWFGITLLFQVFIFMVGVLVGMLTGLSVIQAVFTYIFLLFPTGISILIMFNLNYVLIGFPETFMIEDQVTQYSPITDSVSMLYEMNVSFMKIMIYVVLTLLFAFISLWLYRYRKGERSSQAVVFSPLRPVFKYSFTFCMTLVGGFYFGEVQQEYRWIIFGYIIGSIIGYLLAQMILEKTWRVFTKWKSYFYFVLGCMVLFIMVTLDLTGFEKHIPDTKDIERVYLVEEPYYYNYQNQLERLGAGISSKAVIAEVRGLHEALIDASDRLDPHQYDNETIILRYQLNNNQEVVRQYQVPDLSAFAQYLQPIYQSEEYKKSTNELFSIKNEEVEKIEFISENRLDYEVLADKEKIKQVLEALKKDILAESYQDIRFPTNYLANISLYFSDEDKQPIYLPLKSNYQAFVDWLKQEKLYDDVIITADDVNAIYVKQFEQDTDMIYDASIYFQEEADVIKITEKNKLEELLHSITQGSIDQEVIYGMAIDVKEMEEPIIERLEFTRIPNYIINGLQ